MHPRRGDIGEPGGDTHAQYHRGTASACSAPKVLDGDHAVRGRRHVHDAHPAIQQRGVHRDVGRVDAHHREVGSPVRDQATHSGVVRDIQRHGVDPVSKGRTAGIPRNDGHVGPRRHQLGDDEAADRAGATHHDDGGTGAATLPCEHAFTLVL